MYINKSLKKLAVSLALSGFLFTNFSLNPNIKVEAAKRKIKTEEKSKNMTVAKKKKIADKEKKKSTFEKVNTKKKVRVAKKKELPTIKRWYVNEFVKNLTEAKKMQELLDKIPNESDRNNLKDKRMKQIMEFYRKMVNNFKKEKQKKIDKLFEEHKKNTKESYEIPDEIKDLFCHFFNNKLNLIENENIEADVKSTLEKIGKLENKKVVFICAGFGFDELGAINGKDTSKILNAKMCGKVIKELLEHEDVEVFTPFLLDYANVKFPKNERLHILDKSKGRPPIFGKTGKIYEVSSMYMRALAKEILKDKDKKMISICWYHDSNPEKGYAGIRGYFQKDEYTSAKNIKNSSKLCEHMCRKLDDIYDFSKEGAERFRYNVVEEDWALANLGFNGVKKELKDKPIANGVFFGGNFNNEDVLEKLKEENFQNKAAKAIADGIVTFFPKL